MIPVIPTIPVIPAIPIIPVIPVLPVIPMLPVIPLKPVLPYIICGCESLAHLDDLYLSAEAFPKNYHTVYSEKIALTELVEFLCVQNRGFKYETIILVFILLSPDHSSY